MKPQLSIIMPVLNESAQLSVNLQALQALRDVCELIVVDGGSEDGSADIAAAWVDRLLQSPRGRAAQMNAGARQARADIVLFLHADTVLPDNTVPQIRQAMAAGYAWGRFDVRFNRRGIVFKWIAFMMNQRSRLTGIATGDQAIFVSREAFTAVGGFPDMALMEDVAISARLKRLGKPCCLRDKVVTSARRWEQYGVFKTIFLMWRLRLSFFLGAHPDRLAALYNRRP